jgi:hypothetical protein
MDGLLAVTAKGSNVGQTLKAASAEMKTIRNRETALLREEVPWVWLGYAPLPLAFETTPGDFSVDHYTID